MSTKLKKLYNKQDYKDAVENQNNVSKEFNKIEKRKRKTVQIRISKEWHKKIKDFEWFENITLSSSLDKICKYYFKHHNF